MEKIDVRGVVFDNVTMDEAVAWCVSAVDEYRGGGASARAVFTPNAEIVQSCVEESALYELFASADLTIPDGAGVVLAAKILGTPLKGKVAGVELVERLAAELNRRGGTLYLLGGKPGVAKIAAERLNERYPSLKIYENDGFFEKQGEENDAVVASVNASGADAVYVCFGAPKQERWIAENRGRLNVPLLFGLGGTIDVFAGVKKRAPRIFIALRLEWLYYLIKEPKRIGRMMKLPRFILGTLFRGKGK